MSAETNRSNGAPASILSRKSPAGPRVSATGVPPAAVNAAMMDGRVWRRLPAENNLIGSVIRGLFSGSLPEDRHKGQFVTGAGGKAGGSHRDAVKRAKACLGHHIFGGAEQ